MYNRNTGAPSLAILTRQNGLFIDNLAKIIAESGEYLDIQYSKYFLLLLHDTC